MKKILFTFFTLFITISCANAKEQKVLIKTTEGNITVKLYNETPLHRDNFIKLVKSKFYDGVLFHRVIADFMSQAGDPDSKNAKPDVRLGEGDAGYTVPAEFRTPKIFHKRGALAMARTGDDVNPTKASSGCQFYIVSGKILNDRDLNLMEQTLKDRINADFFQKLVAKNSDRIDRYGKTKDFEKLKSLKDSILKVAEDKKNNDKSYVFSKEQRDAYKTWGGTPHLDGNYTVFGEVIEGMDVMDKINHVKTGRYDRPVSDVKIISMKLI